MTSNRPLVCADAALLPPTDGELSNDRSYPRARGRQVARIAAISAVVVIPCWWQQHIQAGDLSSHLYNAWLALQVQKGTISGLWIANQWTNVLFDICLRFLGGHFGFVAAERLAVSGSVLTFFWGAFAFVCATSRCRASWTMPSLAVLAYGWVFHMGFFNFYVSLGLCFFGMALLWSRSARCQLLSIPFFLLACLAHMLPVLWSIPVIAYVSVARLLRPRHRVYLVGAALGAILALRLLLLRRFEAGWSVAQINYIAGIDQAWVWGLPYYAISLGLLLIWVVLFRRATSVKRPERIVLAIPWQVCFLTACGLFLMPGWIRCLTTQEPLMFIPERMSLASAVVACGCLAGPWARWPERAAMYLLAALFFCGMYANERSLNKIETQVTAAVTGLRPGTRVINGLCQSGSRINSLLHVVDRACIGRCISYGNYEPSMAQFALRPIPGNHTVLADRGDVVAVEVGRYVVKKRDIPLYEVRFSGGQADVELRSLREGEVAAHTCADASLADTALSLGECKLNSNAHNEINTQWPRHLSTSVVPLP